MQDDDITDLELPTDSREERIAFTLEVIIPPEGLEKIELLESDEIAADVEREARRRKIERKQAEKIGYRDQLSHFQRQEAAGVSISARDARKFEAVEAKIAACDEEIRKEQRVKSPPRLNPERVRDWLASRKVHSRYRPVIIKVKSTNPAADLKKVRDKIVAKKSEREAAKFGALPLADQRSRVVSNITKLADSGKPRLHGVRFVKEGPGGRLIQDDVAWPTQYVSGREIPDALALVAYLFRDSIIEKVTAELERRSTGDELSIKDRLDRIAELDATILQLEYDEEALVTLAKSQGLTVHRRPDVSIEAVLQVERADSVVIERRKPQPVAPDDSAPRIPV